MNTLHIYPTSRALRKVSLSYKEQEGFIPTLMRMDEFEQRMVLLDGKVVVDSLQRILFLKKAASFEAFEGLNIDLNLVRFFTKSDAIFKFFEELAVEGVSFDDLLAADAYAEFGIHLELLEKLLDNYQKILEKEGLIDKAFIPQQYKINKAFLQSYDEIEIYLEGYLSTYELMLLEQATEYTTLKVHYTTSPFNSKMQERFKEMGIVLPNHSHLCFSLNDKKVLQSVRNKETLNVKVYTVEQRVEQVAVAFAEIEKLVASGIAPEEIVLILPDEDFKEQFMLFDSHHNLNFAMGYAYSKGRIYRSLDVLYQYWQRFDARERTILERYGINREQVEAVSQKVCDIIVFFEILQGLKLDGFAGNERVHETSLYFKHIFSSLTMSPKEWLFLWLKNLAKITIDDVRGGKITVMGVLETRGIHFEAVVIVDFNEGIVPASSSKDQFLNSSVRAFAKLPTKNDRESLQKQYYKRLLEQATQSVILYSSSANTLASRFLVELGLKEAEVKSGQLNLLYAQSQVLIEDKDPKVENFVASDIVWSASALKTYLDCKRKYYYRYIQKIQAKKEETLNEGAFLHTFLEQLYEKEQAYLSKETMQKEMAMLLDRLLPFEDAKTQYRKLLWKEKFKGFIDTQITHFSSGWRVIEKEKEFTGTIGGLRFKGRIDRIDQNDTETLVLDYKSGSIKEAQKSKNIETLTDLQMSIYSEILSTKYSNLSLAFVQIFEGGAIEEISMLEEKNERLFEVIVELKQTQKWLATKTEMLQKCMYCEFTLLCGRGEYV